MHLPGRIGDGHPAQNHVVLYRKLLAEHDLSDAPDIDDDRYLQGAVQLALGYAGDEYLPEVIGYNLGYEQLPLHLLISAYELSELDIDPYYFTLHVTIDNASTGHAHKAVQALLQLMPMEADREAFWHRVTLGYRLNDLGQGSRDIIGSFDLDREVLEMLERKRPFGQHMHSDYCKFEGKTVNQWLSAPGQLEGFLAAMQNKGWIKRHEDPQNSRFWTLINGAGAAMFGVFSPYENSCCMTGLPVIGWTRAQGPVPDAPRLLLASLRRRWMIPMCKACNRRCKAGRPMSRCRC